MNQLELMVFNVGHGLSVAFVEKPANYVTLVDLGAETGFTPLKSLSRQFKLRPDVLYVTHPHADHIDDVETALDTNFRPLGIYYEEYDWADVRRREKKELAYKIDSYLELIKMTPRRDYGGEAKLTEWHFKPDDAKKAFGETSYVNNSSFFVVYTWRDFKISVGGDQESDAMAGLLGHGPFVKEASKTWILIPPHHGHKNGFPTDWVSNLGKPYISLISVQERDQSIDSRYSSQEFAKGVTIDGVVRNRLTTRSDGNILVKMWYANDGKPKWTFGSF